MTSITGSLLITRTVIGAHSPIHRRETVQVNFHDLPKAVQGTVDALEENDFNVKEVIFNNPENDHTPGNSSVRTIVVEPPVTLSPALESAKIQMTIRSFLGEKGLPLPHFLFNAGEIELNY